MSLVVSTVAQDTLNGVTSSAIDTTGANFLALVLASYATSTEPTVSDSKGNTWTQRTAYTEGLTSRIRIYYCLNATVGTGHTFTASGTASYPAIAVSAHSSIATSSAYDVENGGDFASGTSAAAGSVTPSENGELLIAGWMHAAVGAPGSPSVDSSFTVMGSAGNVSGQSFGVAHAYYYQPTAGAVNPTLSWTTSSNGARAIATFKVTAAGGGVALGVIGGGVGQRIICA